MAWPMMQNGFSGMSSGAGGGSKSATVFGPTEAEQGLGPSLQLGKQNFDFQKYLQGQQQAGETQRAGIAADAAKFPYLLRQQNFGQLFPYLTGQIGNLNNAYTAGGQSPPSPEISVGPVWNQQQVQQQVNSARASNDTTTGSQIKQDQQGLAGRGFGSNSPLLQLLTSSRQMAGNQANATASREIPWQASQGNAQQLLATQQAREQQFASRQQEDIERRKPILQSQTALLQALAGLI